MNASDPALNSGHIVRPDEFRQALGCFASGVAVITTLTEQGEPVGLTVDSFNSVSMEPPLVLWSLGLTSTSLPAFRSHASFIVNVLSSDQFDLCQQFATPDIDRFTGVDWSAGLHGAPILAGTAATLQCLNYRQYEGGDHEILLGEVVATAASKREPLIHNRGQFGTFQAND